MVNGIFVGGVCVVVLEETNICKLREKGRERESVEMDILISRYGYKDKDKDKHVLVNPTQKGGQ